MSFSNFSWLFTRSSAFCRIGRAVGTNIDNSASRIVNQTQKKQTYLLNIGKGAFSTDVFHRSVNTMAAGNGLIFRQMFDKESWTYTYLLADADTKEAVIIDPVIDQVERDVKMIEVNLWLVGQFCNRDRIAIV